MQIIPAIDIIDGKCVRLTKGDFNQKTVYNENPLEVALQFQDAGLERVHLVDLDGARQGSVKNWKILEKLASKTSLQIDFGGGIKTNEDLTIIFNSGAKWATVGSLAVKDENLFKSWLIAYGVEKFMLGADVKDGKLAISGWAEQTSIPVLDFISTYEALGMRQIFCTDISKDGLLEGPSIELYTTIVQQFPSLFFIASGGVSSISDLHELRDAGCRAAIVGKAIYENKIRLKELESFSNQQHS